MPIAISRHLCGAIPVMPAAVIAAVSLPHLIDDRVALAAFGLGSLSAAPRVSEHSVRQTVLAAEGACRRELPRPEDDEARDERGLN